MYCSVVQIALKRPTPAIVFAPARKSSRFAHCWQGAESPESIVQRPRVVRTCGALAFSPGNLLRAKTIRTFPQLTFQKCSEAKVLLPF